MKDQINLLTALQSFENQEVILATDNKPPPGKHLNKHSGQIIPWPGLSPIINKESLEMEKPSPDTSSHILSHAPMGIAITDDAGLILWCNETLALWASDKEGTCLGRTEAGILNCDDPTSVLNHNGPFSLGNPSKGKERLVMRILLEPTNDQQSICYLDVTEEENLRKERTQLAKQLEQHNTVEPISGLMNQRGIILGLEPLISRSRRYQNPLSIVTMTITNIDNIQKSIGQAAADKITLTISQLLRDQLRWADLVGRLESGDFIFVLPETDKNAAIALAKKVAAKFNELDIPADEYLANTPEACFGVASWTKGDNSSQLLTRSADAADTASRNGAFAVEAA